MNDIDTLMQRIDLINTKPAADLTAADTDDVIAYHRLYREKRYGKPAVSASKTSLDPVAATDLRAKLLGSQPKPAARAFVRRV